MSEEQLLLRDSRIHHRTLLALEIQSGSRIREGTVRTYLLRKSQSSLGTFQLGMGSVELFSRDSSDPWGNRVQSN